MGIRETLIKSWERGRSAQGEPVFISGSGWMRVVLTPKPGELPDSYRRYLVNSLREAFDLPGVPIRMMLRKGENPYARG